MKFKTFFILTVIGTVIYFFVYPFFETTILPKINDVIYESKLKTQEEVAIYVYDAAVIAIGIGDITEPGLYGCEDYDGNATDPSEGFDGYFKYQGEIDAFDNEIDTCQATVDENMDVVWIKYGSTLGKEVEMIDSAADALEYK